MHRKEILAAIMWVISPGGCSHGFVRTAVLKSQRRDGGRNVILDSQTLTSRLRFPCLARLFSAVVLVRLLQTDLQMKQDLAKPPITCTSTQGSIEATTYTQTPNQKLLQIDSTLLTLARSDAFCLACKGCLSRAECTQILLQFT